MPAGSIAAIVTDPPYGLEFMGESWDKFAPESPRLRSGWDQPQDVSSIPEVEPVAGSRHEGFVAYHRRRKTYRCRTCGKRDGFRNRHPCGDQWEHAWVDDAPLEALSFQEWTRRWAEVAFRAMRPGAHLVAFGGARTFHRAACGIEDAGFEIRDVLCWLYGQGFPKSLDVSKAIDKAAGVEREVVGQRPTYRPNSGALESREQWRDRSDGLLTLPATDKARQWNGWGTALKPAWEPIILARKLLTGTVAENLRRDDTGALNIDGCRIPTNGEEIQPVFAGQKGPRHDGKYGNSDAYVSNVSPLGRFPANVVLDEEAGRQLDEQAGPVGGGFVKPYTRASNDYYSGSWPDAFGGGHDSKPGGASRFFYCAKASTEERDASGLVDNRHPTVKPVALMRWLCRLITPPGATVLDPFCGSGSTGVAAIAEGLDFHGVELEERFAAVARRRLELAASQGDLFHGGEKDAAAGGSSSQASLPW